MFPCIASPTLRHAYRAIPSIWTSSLDLQMRRRYKDRPPTRLDVMTSFAGANLDVVQVLLLSLSEAHPRDEITFWLFEQRIPAAQLAALADFCAGLGNITLRPVKVPHATDFDRLKTLGRKPDSARFLWFVAHQLLPTDLKRIIYLDALDIIVTDDLVPLLNHPFLGKYLVACREYVDIPPLVIGSARRARDYGLPTVLLRHMSRGLINSGAIVLNLDKFRRDGIEIDHYMTVAEWARDKFDLDFGDQGLFSLTHGSHYARAHDRYNHRFYNELPNRVMSHPAVIHYAGQVLKPARWRLTAELEHLVTDHLSRTGMPQLVVTPRGRLRAAHIPYFRKWWDVCARTPSYARIAPLAAERMATALAEAGLTLESA